MREPSPDRVPHPALQAAADAIARARETVALTRELLTDSTELCATPDVPALVRRSR